MADTAAHLVDRVLPQVPVRQWVLSLPYAVAIFVSAVFASLRRRAREEERFEAEGSRCARVEGFSVHAGVSIRGDDRKGLERLLRYAARPALAAERLGQLPDGRLSYRLKTPWSNGTTHVVFEPLELLGRLAALAPAPRLNLIRFHGVFGPASKWRSSIVPAGRETSTPDAGAPCACTGEVKETSRRRPNYSWARLMARVFEIDVLECPQCKGRLRILAAIHPPENTRRILECLNLPTRGPAPQGRCFRIHHQRTSLAAFRNPCVQRSAAAARSTA
jgi:hypothetical protein